MTDAAEKARTWTLANMRTDGGENWQVLPVENVKWYGKNTTCEVVPVVEQAAYDEMERLHKAALAQVGLILAEERTKLAAETARADAWREEALGAAVKESSAYYRDACKKLAAETARAKRAEARVKELETLLEDAAWTISTEHRTGQHEQCDLDTLKAIRGVLTEKMFTKP